MAAGSDGVITFGPGIVVALEVGSSGSVGSLYVGSPETVARRIAATARALGISRFDMKYSAGAMSHEKLMRSVELYGRKVIPLVRDMLA